jgi:hypothetical protein
MKELVLLNNRPDIFWVRRTKAGCCASELWWYEKRIQNNKDRLILAYEKPVKGDKKGDDQISFYEYSVDFSDIQDHEYYQQVPDWESIPCSAPVEAIDWPGFLANFTGTITYWP